MKISKVLIISKRNAIERVIKQRKLDRGCSELKHLREVAKEHTETLGNIRRVLRKRNIDTEIIKRTSLDDIKIQFTDFDLIITVGGDGTLLNASHYVFDTPVLGVLSSKKGSLGVLCGSSSSKFAEMIDGIAAGKLKQTELQRLQVAIDRVPLSVPALNDVLFAHKLPASTARYQIKFRNRAEHQKSSGVWVSTAAGSTAASLAAGGAVLPIRSKKAVFVVREPFFNQKGRHIIKGALKPGEKLTIVSTTINGAIYIDGQPPCYPVKHGQKVVIGLHPKPVRIFGYNLERRNMIIDANS